SAVYGQSVQMDPSKSGFVGTQVELRCIFVNSNPPVKISQVTWQKLSNGTKQNVATANPTLGVSILSPFKERVGFKQAAALQRHQMEDTTIVFSNLQLSDEAAYICEYTTFPAGNRENMVNLTVFARPMTRMTLTSPTIVARGKKRNMTVATCTSANGKPPSTIKWNTLLKGEATLQETRNPNGTVTVRSSYVVVPSRETHKQKLTCIVTYRGERITDSVVLNLFSLCFFVAWSNSVFLCGLHHCLFFFPFILFDSLNGSLPSNVEIKNNTLFFKGPVTYDLAGTYVCVAINGIGTRTGVVDVNITDLPINPTPRGNGIPPEPHNAGAAIGGAVGGVVLVIVAAILLFVFLRRRQRTFKGDYSTKKHVFGNGYSKAGAMPAHPPIPKNLQYPDDSHDEKKPTQISNTGGFEASERNFDTESEDLKRPYFTVDEGESRDYGERTLAFQYDPEPEIADDMISQTDGSVISKKEWYV
uniref:Nectin cell adhesion molecule 1b n=1 Tax=Xiphophorus couchianus TaxID=32473 RepID=A0A3B5LK57_9TELE